MKIAVVSDTHGDIGQCVNILKDIDNIDLIIHLGDNTSDAKEIADVLQIETIAVKGNCDVHDNITPYERLVNLNRKKIFITHGHKYSVKLDLNSIYYRGNELGADIVLFGHSHNPMLIEYNDILFFNPGSATLPRAGSKKSIGIIELSDIIEAQILNFQ